MKTALQDLIGKLESLPAPQTEAMAGVHSAIISAAKSYLPMERAQIEEAWYNGASSDPLPTHKNAKEYYDKTFNGQ
jgi:hypothetical protein